MMLPIKTAPRARAMAGVWGRPAAAPYLENESSESSAILSSHPILGGRARGGGARRGRGGAKGGVAETSVRDRTSAYARSHRDDMFGT